MSNVTEAGLALFQNMMVPAAFREDPVLKEERVKIRVDVRPKATSIPLAHDGVQSNRVKQGVSEQIVYKRHLNKILSLVEDDTQALERARQTYENKLNAFLRQHLGVEKLKPENRHLYERDIAECRARFSESNVEKEFTEMNLRGVRPLRSVEILEDVPAPASEIESQQTKFVEIFAEALAKALTKVGATAAAPAKASK